MSAVEILTDLMNSVRGKYAVQDKLSLSDATALISKLNMGTVIEESFVPHNNNSDCSEKNGVVHMVCASNDSNGVTGPYFSYDQKVIMPGKRYAFSTLIRGTMTLRQIGPEGPLIKQVNQALSPDDWSLLTLSFIACKDLALYCTAQKGDWVELKDWHFSEMGGVNSTLYLLLLPEMEMIAWE